MEGIVFLLDRAMDVSEDDWRLERIYCIAQTILLHGVPVTFDNVKIVYATDDASNEFVSSKEEHLHNITSDNNVNRVADLIGESKVVFAVGRCVGEVGKMLRTWRGSSRLVYCMNMFSHYALVKAIAKVDLEEQEKFGVSFDFKYRQNRVTGIDFVDAKGRGKVLCYLEYCLTKHSSGWNRTVDATTKTVVYHTHHLPDFIAKVEFQHIMKLDIGYEGSEKSGCHYTLYLKSDHEVHIQDASSATLTLDTRQKNLRIILWELMECIRISSAEGTSANPA